MEDQSTGKCCTAPVQSRLKLAAGAFLVLLVSWVLNDPRQPGPLAMAALAVTLLILGKAACCGLSWLFRESDVRFPQDAKVPPIAMAVKAVIWIGFGTAIPAAFLTTVLFLVGHRPPWMMGHFVHLLLMSFLPTLVACLTLLPYARNQAASSPLSSDRDRGVFAIAAALMLYVVGSFVLMHLNPIHHGLWFTIKHLFFLVVGSFMPSHIPHHIIAVAVACQVLRLWFGCTACVTPGGCGVGDEPDRGPTT